MARPRKTPSVEILKEAYIQRSMSTNEISASSEKLFGYYLSQGTIYNYLIKFGIPPRTKSDGVVLCRGEHAPIRLTEVVGHQNKVSHWNTRYWNARWLVATKKVKAVKSVLSHYEANALRKMLDEYGDNNALPEHLVEQAFKETRKNGFPYMLMSPQEKAKSWDRLIRAKPEKHDDAYYWSGAETTLATAFHPHIYECRKRSKMSPIELFNSDEDLKRAIRKAFCLYGKISDRLINDICRNEDAAGRVGNFPPRVGKSIISELFPNADGISVLDPCAGFGGRLISCAISGISKYVCIDLSPKTYEGLKSMIPFIREMGCKMECDIRHGDCTQELDNVHGEFDLVLTSPPFLDVEEYVGVDTPKDYSVWLESFARPMMHKCISKMKINGKMAVYIGKARTYDIPADFKKIAKEYGLREDPAIFFKMNYGVSRRLTAMKGVEVLVWTKI